MNAVAILGDPAAGRGDSGGYSASRRGCLSRSGDRFSRATSGLAAHGLQGRQCHCEESHSGRQATTGMQRQGFRHPSAAVSRSRNLLDHTVPVVSVRSVSGSCPARQVVASMTRRAVRGAGCRESRATTTPRSGGRCSAHSATRTRRPMALAAVHRSAHARQSWAAVPGVRREPC
jgi:hypothetical protein